MKTMHKHATTFWTLAKQR